MRKEKKKAVERELKRCRVAEKRRSAKGKKAIKRELKRLRRKDPVMKKRSMERELRRLRRNQLQLFEHMAQVQYSLLRLQDDVYEPDGDGGDEVEAPKLRVVGDG